MNGINDVLGQSLMLDEAELQRQEHAKRAIRHNMEDMAEIASRPSGMRFFTRLLTGLGIGRQLDNSPESVALRNYGLQILDELGQANPASAIYVLGQCHNLCEIPPISFANTDLFNEQTIDDDNAN